jgi:hypothetical protein
MEKDARRRPVDAGEVVKRLDELISINPPPRRPSLTKPVATVFALAAVIALIAYWRPWGLSTSAAPSELLQWERLEINVADLAQKTNRDYAIIAGGNQMWHDNIHELGPNSAFSIEGQLSAPAPWIIAWIDTDGKFSFYPKDGQGDGVEVRYPASGMTKINPQDPIGVHLILVLTAESHDPSGASIKESVWAKLDDLVAQEWEKPGNFPSRAWINAASVAGRRGDWRGPPAPPNVLRGAGDNVDEHTPRSYLQTVESRLPKGIVPLAGFFLRTGPE